MSRIGKKPIEIPATATVKLEGDVLKVHGPQGALERRIPDGITVKINPGLVAVNRKDDSRTMRALHGLTRTLISNMVIGVTTGFSKELLIEGVGYRANLKGNTLVLALGYSHPIEFQIPEGIKITVDRQVAITVAGIDKERVGQTAADIKYFRPVEPYKGKGIRYKDQRVHRKVGKVGA